MSIYDEMLRAVAGGVSVVPIRRTTKRPHGKLLPQVERLDPKTGQLKPSGTWKPFQAAIASPDQLERWRGAQAFAAVCGAISGRGQGGRLVLDFDERRFYDAWVTLVGELADGLPVCQTQSGGIYVAMICPSPGGSEKLAWMPNEKEPTGRSVAIETRGERGYAVMPPSPGPEGSYSLLSGSFVDVPVVSQARADALVAAARKLDEAPYTRQDLENAAKVPTATDRARPSLNGQADVIDKFNDRHPLRDVLRSFGYSDADDPMLRPNASATSEPGVTFTKRGGREIAFCHSTNDPLHGEHAHDAFSVYCTLKHGGDFRKAVHAAAVELGIDHKTVAKKEKATKAKDGVDLKATLQVAIDGQKAPVKLPDPWRPFPVDQLPAVLREYVQAADKELQIDASFVILPLLSALGAAIGNTTLALLKGGYVQPALLWTAVVAPSGSGKTPGQTEALRPVVKTQSALYASHGTAAEQYRQDKARYDALPKADRASASEPSPPPELQHILISDATTEAIAVRLNTSPRGVLSAVDELAGLFKSFNSYKKTGNDGETWLGFHGAGFVKVDRKGGPTPTLIIPRAFVAVTGGIQPGVLASIFNDENFDAGLPARFLFAAPPARRRPWTDDEIHPGARAAVEAVFARLFAIPLPRDVDDTIKPRVLPLTDEAKRDWAQWHNEVDQELHAAPEETPYTIALPKVVASAARIALILQLVSHASGEAPFDTRIDSVSMARGVAIARWFKYEQSRVYAGLHLSKAHRRLMRLVETIRSDCGGLVSVRMWQRKRSLKKADLAELELQSVVDAKLGRWEYLPTSKPGQPAKTLVLSDVCLADAVARASGVCQTITDIQSEIPPTSNLDEEGGGPSTNTPLTSDTCPHREAENGADVRAGMPEAPVTVGVKMMVTNAERLLLRILGYGDAEVDRMKPDEAQRIIADGIRREAPPPMPADPMNPTEEEEAASVAWQNRQRVIIE